jgi:hypothetical protein
MRDAMQGAKHCDVQRHREHLTRLSVPAGGTDQRAAFVGHQSEDCRMQFFRMTALVVVIVVGMGACSEQVEEPVVTVWSSLQEDPGNPPFTLPGSSGLAEQVLGLRGVSTFNKRCAKDSFLRNGEPVLFC